MLTLLLAHVMPDDPLRAALAHVLRVVIATAWIVAGAQKLRSPATTRDTVARLLGGPARLQRIVARDPARGDRVRAVGAQRLARPRERPRQRGGLRRLRRPRRPRGDPQRTARGRRVRGSAPAPSTGRSTTPAPRAVARNLVLAILAVAATA